jgi:hypothetical protein
LKADLKCSTSLHTKTNLHLWFFRKAEQELKLTRTYDEENEEVGKGVIRACLKNLCRGLGAVDFQSDIDLLHLTPGISNSNKNDSRKAFFEMRNDAFEVVTEKVQTLMKSGQITKISCTLDKVTVQHKSFTVLVTFFFFEGVIYSTMNELLLMSGDSYDRNGTATMVARSLMETLGLRRTQLASLLTHFRFKHFP